MTQNMIKNTPYPNHYKDVIYIFSNESHLILIVYILKIKTFKIMYPH